MADFKLALRRLAKTPFLTAVAVLSLALGIGANAAIFSLFDQMLLASVPAEEPGALVNLAAPGPKPGSQTCNAAGDCDVVFSYPMYEDLERENGTLAGLAAHRLFGANLADGAQTVNGEGVLVSGSYFPVLGLRPALGRLLGPADDEVVGQHRVAVLAHDYWQNNFGGDPSVLDRTLVINGQSFTIVGVGPRDFHGTTLGSRPSVFVPITMRGVLQPGFDAFENRRNYWAYVFGRLEEGVTIEQARADLNRVYAQIVNDVEAPLQEGMSASTMAQFRSKPLLVEEGRRGQSGLHGEARVPLLLLFGITGIVLLIACANIANLLLVRGAQRAQEIAIRGSLGASRGRLLGQLLTESVVLAALGGVGGLLVAQWTLSGIGAMLPAEAAATLDLRLQPQVLLFAAVVAMGTGVLFGLYPALHSTRPDLVTALKSATGQASGARAAARFRSALVTGQIALSMALLVAAGLFLRSLANVSRVDLGFETDGVVMFAVSPQLNGYEPTRSQALFEELEERLAAVPGVDAVTTARIAAVGGNSWGTDVSVEGFEAGPDVDSNSRMNWVGTEYFSTMGVPLVGGREFTRADAEGALQVAVVNEAFARKFGMEPREAVGKWMSTGGSGQDELDVQIVGVVQDAAYSDVKDEVPPLFYLPWRQEETMGSIYAYARTDGDPSAVLSAVPGLVAQLDPNLPVQDLRTMEQQVRESVFMDRVIGTLTGAFALLATLLASVGLYGVLSYTVAQRTREIGLRMALGADGARVRGMVMRQVVGMVAVGSALGIAAALGIGRAAQSLLYEMEGNDPTVLAATAVGLILVALAAAWLPALRASRVDPMDALRYE